MNFNDKVLFSKKMMEIATSLSRTIDDEDVDIFFNQLEEHPIDLVVKGMDQALRDRDPEDPFLKTMMLTVPEIRAAIERITEPSDDEVATIRSCGSCHGKGWLTGKDGIGHFIARPCECLYNSARKALARKKSRQSSMDTSIDAFRRRIVKAYEYHQKKCGMEIPREEK